MTESDEQMLIRFFDENRQEIEDNGFTARVSRQLPSRAEKLSRIWSVICWIVGIALFFMMDGVGQIYQVGLLIINEVVGMVTSMNLSFYSFMAVLLLLILMASVKVYHIAID